MALETGTYINDFVTTNPTGADDRSTADDHLRLIKTLIKASFPGVTGAATATHGQLNYVSGVTAGTALADKALVLNASKGITGITSASIGTMTGAVTGNVTGNTSGSSGSCTGNAVTATTATSATTAGTITSQGALATLNTVGAAQIDAGAVATETALIAANIVGSYSFLRNSTGSTLSIGDTAAGSSLYPADSSVNVLVTARSGTWRCMAYAINNQATVFLRIS